MLAIKRLRVCNHRERPFKQSLMKDSFVPVHAIGKRFNKWPLSGVQLAA
jgi:hypothetical protein